VINKTNTFIEETLETFQIGQFAFCVKSKRFGTKGCQLPDPSFIIPL
jgi:hypothetical protein